MPMRTDLLILMLLNLVFAGSVTTGNAVTPGELIVERPTLICLGFEWRSKGTRTTTPVSPCVIAKGDGRVA